jgi:hypothetical protein
LRATLPSLIELFDIFAALRAAARQITPSAFRRCPLRQRRCRAAAMRRAAADATLPSMLIAEYFHCFH